MQDEPCLASRLALKFTRLSQQVQLIARKLFERCLNRNTSFENVHGVIKEVAAIQLLDVKQKLVLPMHRKLSFSLKNILIFLPMTPNAPCRPSISKSAKTNFTAESDHSAQT